jgi:hypothetical protein
MLEPRGQAVNERHDLVAARYRQFSARAEIVLKINDQEHILVADAGSIRHRSSSRASVKRSASPVW